MPFRRNECRRILIVSLSNIGDVFLTVPVVRAVQEILPDAKVTVLVGEAAREIFQGDPRLHEVIPYDKKAPFRKKWRLIQVLRRKHFDLVVDLRNSLFPFLVGSPFQSSLWRWPPREILHKMDQHLWKLKGLGIPMESWDSRDTLWIRPEAEQRMRQIFETLRLPREEPFILLSPGSKSDLKRWKAASFAVLADRLHQEKQFPLLFVGEKSDKPFVEGITSFMTQPFHSLVGETSLSELVVLVRASKLLVTSDSATLHIASLLGTPTVALFGPTDPKKYGPRAEKSRVVRKELFCSPCEKARCPYHHECMEQLSSEEVFKACLELLC